MTRTPQLAAVALALMPAAMALQQASAPCAFCPEGKTEQDVAEVSVRDYLKDAEELRQLFSLSKATAQRMAQNAQRMAANLDSKINGLSEQMSAKGAEEMKPTWPAQSTAVTSQPAARVEQVEQATEQRMAENLDHVNAFSEHTGVKDAEEMRALLRDTQDKFKAATKPVGPAQSTAATSQPAAGLLGSRRGAEADEGGTYVREQQLHELLDKQREKAAAKRMAANLDSINGLSEQLAAKHSGSEQMAAKDQEEVKLLSGEGKQAGAASNKHADTDKDELDDGWVKDYLKDKEELQLLFGTREEKERLAPTPPRPAPGEEPFEEDGSGEYPSTASREKASAQDWTTADGASAPENDFAVNLRSRERERSQERHRRVMAELGHRADPASA